MDAGQRSGGARRAEKGELLFGNMDTWVIWNLTGGPKGGVHVTDVTNASRTLLMNLQTLDWDDRNAEDHGHPQRDAAEDHALQREVYGTGGRANWRASGRRRPGRPAGGALRPDLFQPWRSQEHLRHGLLHAAEHGHQARPIQERPADHARLQDRRPARRLRLEGSIAITGALVQWLRDNLGLISKSADVEALARRWRITAASTSSRPSRACSPPTGAAMPAASIVGMTRYVNKGHMARAALEATAFQTREVLDAMKKDSGVDLTALKVDGGMVFNDLLMQFQADILGVPVIRPTVAETTSLGRGLCSRAGGRLLGQGGRPARQLGQGSGVAAEDGCRRNATSSIRVWKKAVTRTFDWVEA